MPELAEVRIMSEYINHHSDGKTFESAYHVAKGNIPEEFHNTNFQITSESNGKELLVKIDDMSIYCFMGMSGNWKWVPTEEWSDIKHTRLRFDTNDGWSLLMYGGYMGPKYSVGKPFTGTRRGPDPTRNFENFKHNVINNLHLKVFDKPICEVLLNQKFFNGIGNYLRSTILFYVDIDPFQSARQAIEENIHILDMCRDISNKAYQLNGGQLRDWKNPFDTDYEKFREWVFYQKGLSCKDATGRTFWFNEKWRYECPYEIRSNKRTDI